MVTETIKCNGRQLERRHRLDFLDLGGSKGASYRLVSKKFGLERGLCIDLSPEKVAQALADGVPALELDATRMLMFADKCCKVVSMVHFLEHLPTMGHVRDVIGEALRLASEKVYIKGPPFHDEYLGGLGVRYYWAHWTGHPTHVEVEDIVRILQERGVTPDRIETKFIKPVLTTDDPCIQSVQCEIDRHSFEAENDPSKPEGVPLVGAYREFEIIVRC
jgi:SAM-dependent methyltransferase